MLELYIAYGVGTVFFAIGMRVLVYYLGQRRVQQWIGNPVVVEKVVREAIADEAKVQQQVASGNTVAALVEGAVDVALLMNELASAPPVVVDATVAAVDGGKEKTE